MLEVIFLGVGEAFDEALSNTSILIRYEGGDIPASFLLDCGFTAPPPFWSEESNVNRLDGIYISHFHADHGFGIPALLVRFWEQGRDKELIFLGQKGIESFTRKCLDLAYPGFYERFTFPLSFVELAPGRKTEILGVSFRVAETAHSQPALALRIDVAGKSIYYSGDGKPTPESMALARESELIIHEAFHMETEIPGHGTITGSIDMAKRCNALLLALVHIQREVRKQAKDRIDELKEMSNPVNLIIPEPGYRLTI
jgi:ribonuclease Z